MKPISFTSPALRPSSWGVRDRWRSTVLCQSADKSHVVCRTPEPSTTAGEREELIDPRHRAKPQKAKPLAPDAAVAVACGEASFALAAARPDVRASGPFRWFKR